MNRNNIKHICFDLDGTLVDSNRTIYKTTLKSLATLGINNSFPEEEFNQMIGMHFIDIFNELSIDVPDFQEFIRIYKSYYFDFIDDSILYPDVNLVLGKLAERGIKTSLLTTKAQDQADKIIDHFRLREYISYVMGRRDGIENKPSPEPLIIICGKLKVKTEETLIVGDTELDIQCGKNAGAKTCGVLYGYRTEVQIKKEEPDFILKNIQSLIELI